MMVISADLEQHYYQHSLDSASGKYKQVTPILARTAGMRDKLLRCAMNISFENLNEMVTQSAALFAVSVRRAAMAPPSSATSSRGISRWVGHLLYSRSEQRASERKRDVLTVFSASQRHLVNLQQEQLGTGSAGHAPEKEGEGGGWQNCTALWRTSFMWSLKLWFMPVDF